MYYAIMNCDRTLFSHRKGLKQELRAVLNEGETVSSVITDYLERFIRNRLKKHD